MSFNCGIIGLPNVGKSTLFNALTETEAAQSANYPFCTIEPNIGRVAVPDKRLDAIAALADSQKIIPAQLEFVDIAGLVKGAAKGEGLGNQFLGNIRSVDAICHLLRCFDNDDITHVHNVIDPVDDAQTVNIELLLADIESLEKRLPNLQKKIRGGDKESQKIYDIIHYILPFMEQGQPARNIALDSEQKKLVDTLQLLTTKPVLYVCNVMEDDAKDGNIYTKKVAEMALEEQAECVIICAAIEAEIVALVKEDRHDFLQSLGLDETGLNRVIRHGYNLLNRISFFTAGPKEARSWSIVKGINAQEAAGSIHSDMARGFIASETMSYQDYIDLQGEQACKEQGKLRIEGRDYLMQDGDICHFRFNV